MFCPPWDQNSVTFRQHHRNISQIWQTTVNLWISAGLLKIYSKTPILVEFHMLKCLKREVSPSSSYQEISSLFNSLAKLLVKPHSTKLHKVLGNKSVLPLFPFSQSPAVLPATLTPQAWVLHHTVLLNCLIRFSEPRMNEWGFPSH